MITDQRNLASKKFTLPDLLLILGLSILLCAEGYFGYRLHALSSTQEQIKEDYSVANSITFGLFSIDEWRDKIVSVVNGRVQGFKMTREQQKQLQAQVEQQLHGLITKAIAQINKPQKTFSGKLKRFALNKFVNEDQVQAQVPSFAKTIIDEVNSPASINRLKNIATGQIDQLKKETYDSTANAIDEITHKMFNKYHVSNGDEFTKQVNTQLASFRTITYNYAFAMVGCIVITLGTWWLMRKRVHLHSSLFIVSLLFAFVLLVVGLTSTIIEVDARIQTLSFMLMGRKVAFENQMLFFQSKSVYDIVELLLKQPKPDAVLVGSLIAVFVIVFPVVKLIATGVHILSTRKFAENKVVRYFAFESNKWCMDDVMVVGMLMTYIGLNGLLESQLTNLNTQNDYVTAITANNTSLQPGYVVFVGFVFFNIILSTILKRITPHDVK